MYCIPIYKKMYIGKKCRLKKSPEFYWYLLLGSGIKKFFLYFPQNFPYKYFIEGNTNINTKIPG